MIPFVKQFTFHTAQLAPSAASLLLIFLLAGSSQLQAKTFFEPSTEKPSGYFNNEAVRQERIDHTKVAPTKHFSEKHRLVSDFFNSDKDQAATHTEWESRHLLRIGVVRRSLNKKVYSAYACDVVSAAGLSNTVIRIIYLPSLIASQQLDILHEQQCS